MFRESSSRLVILRCLLDMFTFTYAHCWVATDEQLDSCLMLMML